jgi:hypothetical protein
MVPMKGLIFALFLIPVAIAAFAVGSSASAQTDPVNCGSFDSQAEAQAVLDADPLDEHGLDPEDNGIACEDYDYAAAEAAAAAEAEAAAAAEAEAAAEPAAVPSTGGPPISSNSDLTGLALLGAMLLIVGGLSTSLALRSKSR